MDAPAPSARTSIAVAAPLHVSGYGLTVRDLGRCVAFYETVVGLETLERDGAVALLGAGGVPLLTLTQRDGLVPDDRKTAGLFHAAFVLPDRAALARWYHHAKAMGLPIERTGDHLVNEAIYYDDPEGNGCECYADRPPETWDWDADGLCSIEPGIPVDIESLTREAPDDGAAWAPSLQLRVGHLNLRVGDYREAERFYSAIIGLDWTGRRHINFAGQPDVTITFMSSGRYHHHFAANDFTSRGAGLRAPNRAGLDFVAFAYTPAFDIEAVAHRLAASGAAVERRGEALETRDPWGTRVRFAPA